jgi:hypothetical protein
MVSSASVAMTTDTFNYTGSYQTFIVPEGITSISFNLIGASGGSATSGGTFGMYDVYGGTGGSVSGILNVFSGQYLYIFVGGYGSATTYGSTSTLDSLGGYNGGGNGLSGSGGGGGGATDIRIGGIDLINRIAVAAGGGGANTIAGYGGGPGGVIDGINGWYLNGSLGSGSNGDGGGGGGGYYGGVGGVYGYSRTSGAGGNNWADTQLVTSITTTEGGGSLEPIQGVASISFNPVPEPSTYALFGLGVIGVLMVMRRKKTA